MKRILVTGGAGAIGRNLVAALLRERAAEVTVLDDGSSGRPDLLPKAVRLYRGDVADSKLLDRVLARPFQEIYHLAAFFANQNSVDHPLEDFRTNALGTLLLLEKASRLRGLKVLVFASTSSMTGDLDKGLPDGFSTPYMASKFTGELYGRYYRAARRLPFRTVRYYNCYGPGEFPGRYRNVVINFIDRALRGERLQVTGTGSETRDFTFVDDIVAGTLAVARSPKASAKLPYAIGTGTETRIRDLAAMVNRLTGNRAPIQFIPQRSWDKTRRRRADFSPTRRDAGYRPVVALPEGLERTLAWFKSVS
ncbi:MAG TPA: hypothetical protein DCM05_03785 [Elusimicrobia bacterium]|nr:hypothetical protein [Elusimicrobiota bacterium]